MILRQDLEKMLTELEEKEKLVNMALSHCPPGQLMLTRRGGQLSYVQVIKGEDGRIRHSINRKQSIVAGLARKKYLQEELQIIEKDVQAIKTALSFFCDASAENILRRMPQKYRELPQEYFFAGSGEKTARHRWEHCGLTGNKEYMRHHKWKLEQYETAGIVPWKNLIITYDDEQGNIDLRIIESEIRNKLL